MSQEGVLIDCGGLDKFIDRDTPDMRRFWGRYGNDAVHFITPIVYWEFLNKYDTYNPFRKKVQTLIAKGKLQFIPFGQEAADLASKIYIALKPLVDSIPKKKKRERLEPLQCDVFIAASACLSGKSVFTMDTMDWQLIRRAISQRALSIRPLTVIFGMDLLPEEEEEEEE